MTDIINKGRPLPPVETRWKKGISGNPRGRPKKQERLAILLRKELGKICPADRAGRTWEELLILASLQLALKGNATAFKELWDRLDGRVPQTGKMQLDARLQGSQPRREMSRKAQNEFRALFGLPPREPERRSKKSK